MLKYCGLASSPPPPLYLQWNHNFKVFFVYWTSLYLSKSKRCNYFVTAKWKYKTYKLEKLKKEIIKKSTNHIISVWLLHSSFIIHLLTFSPCLQSVRQRIAPVPHEACFGGIKPVRQPTQQFKDAVTLWRLLLLCSSAHPSSTHSYVIPINSPVPLLASLISRACQLVSPRVSQHSRPDTRRDEDPEHSDARRRETSLTESPWLAWQTLFWKS